MWRGGGRQKPSEPHRPTEIAVIDGAFAIPVAAAVIALATQLTDYQIIAIGFLAVTGQVLGFLKKHERQLHGIYRTSERGSISTSIRFESWPTGHPMSRQAICPTDPRRGRARVGQ